jgi:hypothetical protein
MNMDNALFELMVEHSFRKHVDSRGLGIICSFLVRKAPLNAQCIAQMAELNDLMTILLAKMQNEN